MEPFTIILICLLSVSIGIMIKNAIQTDGPKVKNAYHQVGWDYVDSLSLTTNIKALRNIFYNIKSSITNTKKCYRVEIGEHSYKIPKKTFKLYHNGDVICRITAFGHGTTLHGIEIMYNQDKKSRVDDLCNKFENTHTVISTNNSVPKDNTDDDVDINTTYTAVTCM